MSVDYSLPRLIRKLIQAISILVLSMHVGMVVAQPLILKSDSFRHYVDSFNVNDNELYKNYIPNEKSWEFLSDNIPLLDCPDKEIETSYYFRWWTFRKHIKSTPEGFVITEFLPNVPWAGKYNAISCPAAFHFYEGRWMHDARFLNDYAKYWFEGGGDPRLYSFWAADAIYNFSLVSNDFGIARKLLPALVENYEQWEINHLDSAGLFWQVDDRDGMEVSICGAASKGVGYRATINSYMYGDAIAIEKIARLTKQYTLATKYERKARRIKLKVEQQLWDDTASFFKVLPRIARGTLCSARELHGYTPWFFNMPDNRFSKAWSFVVDKRYFVAPYGLTTAEQNHRDFRIAYSGHECQWNGPSWPYATSITLKAMANLLRNYKQQYVNQHDFYTLLHIYAKSHRIVDSNGRVLPWIDENLNPFTGDWISRTRLKNWNNGTWSMEKGGVERGKDYNHSSFCDLVVSDLIGIQPQSGDYLVINPLLPNKTWKYFCLDNVKYHDKIVTILYDETGTRYNMGIGFKIFIDGKLVASATDLRKLKIPLQSKR
jgi:hypothetical protein